MWCSVSYAVCFMCVICVFTQITENYSHSKLRTITLVVFYSDVDCSRALGDVPPELIGLKSQLMEMQNALGSLDENT